MIADALDARRAAWLTAGLAALALALALLRLAQIVPPRLWASAAWNPAPDDAGQLVFHYAVLPRLCVAALCGAALGLAGALFQQTLRNPLASPTTLGIEAGAGLALAAATLWAPGWLAGELGREGAALAGGLAAGAVVFGVASARGLSSVSLVLAGLVTGLVCGALGAVLKLTHQEWVPVLFIWGAGSLAQGDWSAAAGLLPRLVGLAALTALLARPLALLALDEASARALGLRPAWVRGAGLLVAVALTAVVAAAVGVIGFVGLAAPQIARAAGARRLGTRLWLAPIVGAGLLVAVDQGVQAAGDRLATLLPTGAATALLGAPLLLWLLPRLRLGAGAPSADGAIAAARAATRPRLLALGLVLLGAVAVAALLGRSDAGWQVAGWQTAWPDALALLTPWRLPRIAVAASGGAMLAAAGTLLQRLTGNPMAGPELLGIGTGVAAGLVAALLLASAPSPLLQGAAGACGALLVLGLLLGTSSRSRFAPEPLLLTGLALGALLDAVVVGFLALGDPRAGQVLGWIAGSTYRADTGTAWATLALAAALLAATLPLVRWLDLLPLGEAAARGLGVPLTAARLSLTGLAALLTACAMLVVGPLSFVGLMGPHLARALGLQRAGPQLAGSILVGAIVMVAADWIGRVAIVPLQLPAGLVAALIGGPYLVWHLTRRQR